MHKDCDIFVISTILARNLLLDGYNIKTSSAKSAKGEYMTKHGWIICSYFLVIITIIYILPVKADSRQSDDSDNAGGRLYAGVFVELD